MTDQRPPIRSKYLTPSSVAGGGIAAVILLATPTVMHWEGLRNDPYLDVGGIRTVCYGETASVQNRRYSRAECEVMLERSLIKHATPVLKCLPLTAPLEVKAAFVSFGYNVGVSAACGSKAAQAARRGDYRVACRALGNWVFVGKRRVQGLVNRRADETSLCLKGVV